MKNVINENNTINNGINSDNYILNLLSNYTEPRYIIKRPGKNKNYSLDKNKKRIKNLLNYNMEEKINKPYISKSGEKNYHLFKKNNDITYLNSYMENLITNTEYSSDYPYNGISDRREKKVNVNIYKTLSSQEESTSNHISLIQESNEIRKPKNSINLSIKNKKNYFSPDKSYNISHPNQLLTERRGHKSVYPKHMETYNEDTLPNIYNSQTNIKNDPPLYQFNKILPQYNSFERRIENSNIYLYTNEDDNNNIIYNNNNLTNNNYINKPQYYYNDSQNYNIYNMNNMNNINNMSNKNTKKINPLFERMRQSKMNNRTLHNSPFSRKVIRDNNQIKIIYNNNNQLYNLVENDEYNNNNMNNYHNGTMGNNYNIKNVFY